MTDPTKDTRSGFDVSIFSLKTCENCLGNFQALTPIVGIDLSGQNEFSIYFLIELPAKSETVTFR
jgi:hypothetical protein